MICQLWDDLIYWIITKTRMDVREGSIWVLLLICAAVIHTKLNTNFNCHPHTQLTELTPSDLFNFSMSSTFFNAVTICIFLVKKSFNIRSRLGTCTSNYNMYVYCNIHLLLTCWFGFSYCIPGVLWTDANFLPDTKFNIWHLKSEWTWIFLQNFISLPEKWESKHASTINLTQGLNISRSWAFSLVPDRYITMPYLSVALWCNV